MALIFTNVEQSANSNGVKVLIYSDSGGGKTVLAATAPRPILLSAESGVLSLKRKNLERLFGVNNPAVCYNVPIIQIETVGDLTEAHTWLSQSAEAKNFDTVCVDSLTEIAEVVLNNAKRQVKDPRAAYGELIEKMETSIRAFRDLKNKHVYMSAKMAPSKDELTGSIKYGPSMPGAKLGPALPYFFDEVFRLGINKDQQGKDFRFLQTNLDFQFTCKDRSGSLNAMEYPFLTDIFNKILGD